MWLLAVATLIPIALLSWLGVRILRQDRDVERQRQRAALDLTSRRLALDIERQLQDREDGLARGDAIVFTAEGPIPSPAFPLLYQPVLPDVDDMSAPGFAEARAAEFQHRDLATAAEAYRSLTGSLQPSVRAAALVGLAAVLRQRGDVTGALRAYDDLEILGATVVAGQPSALVARYARCRILEKAGESAGLRTEAAEFSRVLNAGGWRLDQPTFENYQAELERWGAPLAAPAFVARTAAVVHLWASWRAGTMPATGRRVLTDSIQPVLAMWTGGPDRPTVWLATSRELTEAFAPLAAAQSMRIAGHDGDGHQLFGDAVVAGVSLMPSETRLPFVLSVAPIDATAQEAQGGIRRTGLVSGLAVAFLLMMAAAYGLYRATTWELALARQQTDFVSAVSHEFRTPLTSMRHLTDLLATRGVQSEERRAHYFNLLAHETERLHRLVETLLSFGRIEAGAYAWRLEPVDAGALLRQTVEEFRVEPIAKTRQIACDVEPGLPAILADADALSRALWNLLENAAKYSAPDAPIGAFARRSGSAVHLGVGDRGIGIQPAEQAGIFQKFVRGADATTSGIRGVGIGLALVKRIAEAHGGSVCVDSEPGRGSTFTLVIPCNES